MAMRTRVEFSSDLSGAVIRSENPTVEFGIDGVSYEIDLTDAEQRKLRDAVSSYLAGARKATPGRGRRAPRRSGAGEASAIRAWARENGYDVSARGRIPAPVREAYAAHA